MGIKVSLMPDISYEKHPRFAWIRLDCVDGLLAPSVAAELTDLCEVAESDDEIEILLLTGTNATFCTGLKYIAEQGVSPARAIQDQFGSLLCCEALAGMTKPTLAVLNGDAIGVGLELALACDLRLAKAGSRFGLSQVNEGLIPFCGGTQRLPRIVGQAKALELILTGALLDAAEAQRIGLITEVIPAGTLTARVNEVVTNLLGNGPIALRLGKEAVHKAMDLTLDQGIRLEEDLYVLLQTTQDRAEGVHAFLGKRKPVFTGR